jgi:hypothetical protein
MGNEEAPLPRTQDYVYAFPRRFRWEPEYGWVAEYEDEAPGIDIIGVSVDREADDA